jgi:ABC-type uncharacterized transport system ATPase subunit
MITTEKLTKKFGDITAVDHLNLKFKKARYSVFLDQTAQEKLLPFACFPA